MKALKLIKQQRDKHDRRVVWTQISAAGLDLLGKMDPEITRAPKDLLGHLDRKDLAELTRLLELARKSCLDTAGARQLLGRTMCDVPGGRQFPLKVFGAAVWQRRSAIFGTSTESAGNDLLRDYDLVGVRLDDLVVQTIKSKLEAIGNTQLVVNLAQVVLDDLFCRSKLESDLLVALALSNAGDNRCFLGREPGLSPRADQAAAWARYASITQFTAWLSIQVSPVAIRRTQRTSKSGEIEREIMPRTPRR